MVSHFLGAVGSNEIIMNSTTAFGFGEEDGNESGIKVQTMTRL